MNPYELLQQALSKLKRILLERSVLAVIFVFLITAILKVDPYPILILLVFANTIKNVLFIALESFGLIKSEDK